MLGPSKHPSAESAPLGQHAKVRCDPLRGAVVRAWIEMRLSLGPERAWGLVGDFARFAVVDPFHGRVQISGAVPRRGAALLIEHSAFGLAFFRRGRLLRWAENESLAFSDLSARGPRSGFPHVFSVTLEPLGESSSMLRVEVRGKWTARWIPRPLARAWVFCICVWHARLLERAFERYAQA